MLRCRIGSTLLYFQPFVQDTLMRGVHIHQDEALAVLGEGYLGEGDAPRAIDMIRRAAEKDPALGKARYNLGQALEAAGRLQEARPEYEQATRLLAPFPEAHYALANLLVKLGEPRD